MPQWLARVTTYVISANAQVCCFIFVNLPLVCQELANKAHVHCTMAIMRRSHNAKGNK